MASQPREQRVAETPHVGRILVIAQEFEVVDAVTEYFADLGYEAHGAIESDGALPTVRRSAPEVILLDVQMPRLANLFRELRAAWNIPIIIATENAEVARELRPLGAFAYIHKPFDWDDLRRRVAMVIYSALRSADGPCRMRGAR
jgi:DNA-binding response OmpR family regulator